MIHSKAGMDKEETTEIQVWNGFILLRFNASADLTALNFVDFIQVPLWSEGRCSILPFNSSQLLIIQLDIVSHP